MRNSYNTVSDLVHLCTETGSSIKMIIGFGTWKKHLQLGNYAQTIKNIPFWAVPELEDKENDPTAKGI